ncbi:RNA helicase, partial [Salmonella enterica]|nr:RNA helicase [Salmonella enterica]EDF5065294.1 RNA helicase [Salmonella enterica]EDJ4459930.1 RNA helicase [Salmonella enterica]HAB4011034.1 RNA helicase [Salmonella enterica subsp. enterica serovar Dublin]
MTITWRNFKIKKNGACYEQYFLF